VQCAGYRLVDVRHDRIVWRSENGNTSTWFKNRRDIKRYRKERKAARKRAQKIARIRGSDKVPEVCNDQDAEQFSDEEEERESSPYTWGGKDGWFGYSWLRFTDKQITSYTMIGFLILALIMVTASLTCERWNDPYASLRARANANKPFDDLSTAEKGALFTMTGLHEAKDTYLKFLATETPTATVDPNQPPEPSDPKKDDAAKASESPKVHPIKCAHCPKEKSWEEWQTGLLVSSRSACTENCVVCKSCAMDKIRTTVSGNPRLQSSWVHVRCPCKDEDNDTKYAS